MLALTLSKNRDYLLDEIFGEQRRRHYREKFRQVDNRGYLSHVYIP